MTWSRVKPRSVKYGKGWAATRKEWAARHDPYDACTRCRRPLGPMGRWLHLDHNDVTGAVDGFAHAACNVRAGAELGRARQQGRAAAVAVPPRREPLSAPLPVATAGVCRVCGARSVGRSFYCGPPCQAEYNARASRERYRERQGLPPTWDRPRSPHVSSRAW